MDISDTPAYIRSLSQSSSSHAAFPFEENLPYIHRPQISPTRNFLRPTASPSPQRPCRPYGGGGGSSGPRAGHDAAGAGRRTLRRRPRPLRLLLPPPQAFSPSLPLASPALLLLVLLNPFPETSPSPPRPHSSLHRCQCGGDFSIARVLLRGPDPLIRGFIDWRLIPLSSVASDFMGDLACDSERVPMEGHDSSFICEDDKVLLEAPLTPAGQTLCSCGELHHSQDGTHEQCMNGDSVENEVDISGSRNSGIKRGKGSGGNSQGVSECSEPKESSTCERSPSFLSSVRLVSAMKGGRERSGEASPTEARRVKWAPDVYDPPVTSVDHSVKSLQQRPRSRKKEKNKQKHKKKRKSRGNGKNSGVHDAVHIPPALEVPGPSSPDDCDLEPEVLDYDTGGGQEAGQAMLDEATSSRQGPF